MQIIERKLHSAISAFFFLVKTTFNTQRCKILFTDAVPKFMHAYYSPKTRESFRDYVLWCCVYTIMIWMYIWTLDRCQRNLNEVPNRHIVQQARAQIAHVGIKFNNYQPPIWIPIPKCQHIVSALVESLL